MKMFVLFFSLVIWSVPGLAQTSDLEYYKQFLYRVDKDMTDPDYPVETHRYLMAQFPLEIPIGDDKLLVPSIHIALYEDGTYYMMYREAIQPVGSSQLFPGRCVEVRGKWSVPADQMLMDDLSVSVRHFADNQNKIKMTFNRDLVTPGLKGREVIFSLGFSNIDPTQDPSKMFCLH